MSKMMPGIAEQVANGIVRIVAPNGGMMTGPGTNTYVLGHTAFAVIDPGPAMPEQTDAIIRYTGDKLRWILVTHTHRDHSPGAQALHEMTGARLIGLPPPDAPLQDKTFVPDYQPADGEVLNLRDFQLQAIHTPGHASNHVCYLEQSGGMLFSGDHINQGSTVVIAPPDGSMSLYLGSLERLKGYPLRAIAPGHGSIIDEPRLAIDRLINHRRAREARTLRLVEKNPGLTVEALTTKVYTDVSSLLHEIAQQSLLAHLLKLADDGEVVQLPDKGWVVNT